MNLNAVEDQIESLSPMLGGGSRILNFYQALEKVVEGKRITRLDWGDAEYWGFLHDDKLMLRKPDGKLHEWIVSLGDLVGDDWVVIQEEL